MPEQVPNEPLAIIDRVMPLRQCGPISQNASLRFEDGTFVNLDPNEFVQPPVEVSERGQTIRRLVEVSISPEERGIRRRAARMVLAQSIRLATLKLTG